MKGHVGGGPGSGNFKVSATRVTKLCRSKAVGFVPFAKHVLSRIHYVIRFVQERLLEMSGSHEGLFLLRADRTSNLRV